MPLPPLQILNGRPPMVSGVLLGFDIILNINEQTGTTVTLFQLSGWAQASGDPGGYGFLRVIGAQSLEPGEPLLIRRSCRTIFPRLISYPSRCNWASKSSMSEDAGMRWSMAAFSFAL